MLHFVKVIQMPVPVHTEIICAFMILMPINSLQENLKSFSVKPPHAGVCSSVYNVKDVGCQIFIVIRLQLLFHLRMTSLWKQRQQSGIVWGSTYIGPHWETMLVMVYGETSAGWGQDDADTRDHRSPGYSITRDSLIWGSGSWPFTCQICCSVICPSRIRHPATMTSRHCSTAWQSPLLSNIPFL